LFNQEAIMRTRLTRTGFTVRALEYGLLGSLLALASAVAMLSLN
jgi:hypothetical protein